MHVWGPIPLHGWESNVEDCEREYYGSNRDRLRTIKAKYDSENVFSFEQSLPVG